VGLALRLGVDFVAGVVVGVVVGLLLDWWLGISPAMLILFFLLGAAAGTFNVFRTASGQGGAVGFKRARDAAKDAERDGARGDAQDDRLDDRGPDERGPDKRG